MIDDSAVGDIKEMISMLTKQRDQIEKLERERNEAREMVEALLASKVIGFFRLHEIVAEYRIKKVFGPMEDPNT